MASDHGGIDGRPESAWGLGVAEAVVIAAAMVLHLAHQAWFADFTIEDAAIVFAYARNIADGEGIVPWPGGERIEACSSPLWLLLLTLFQLVGIDGWTSSKVLAGVFGAACLPMAWWLARRALPDDERRYGALMAPIFLAYNTSHAVWSASALENSLFNVVLLAGIIRMVRELDDASLRPWSAVIFFLMGLTRPEGILYAAAAGGIFLACTLRDGRGPRPAAMWFVAFWVPYLAVLGLRIWYFAWPFPSTYYAKMGSHDWHVLHQWNSRGWAQIRQFAQQTWLGITLPVYVFGLTTVRGWRGRVGLAVVLGLGLALLIPGPEFVRWRWFWPSLPQPTWWLVLRIVAIALTAGLLPLAAVGTHGWRARVLCWVMVVVAVFFSVYSMGDWMLGLRWMSLFACTSAVLFAVGVTELAWLAARLGGQPTWGIAGMTVASLLTLGLAPPHLSFSKWYLTAPEFVPLAVKRRVDHTTAFADRVFLDEQVRTLDMDMGAHLWWGHQHIIDMAGLVDMSMALHDYTQRDFVQEHVYDEGRPHFAHIHATWAEISALKTYPGFGETYFGLRGYPDGEFFHAGMYARRSLVMSPSWDGPGDRRVTFARGVVLEGFDVPSPEVGQGRSLYLDVGLSSMRREADDPFTVTAFLSGPRGVEVSWDLPMGYGALPIDAWREDEVFDGHFSVELPGTIPPGTYDLGFVVFGARGYVLAAGGPDGTLPVAAAASVAPDRVALARGEVRFPGVVQVLPGWGASDTMALHDRLAALEAAWEGRCDEAEAAWRLARLHVPRHDGFVAQFRPEMGVALSRCWVEQARARPDERVELITRARTWDHRNQELQTYASAVADELYADAMAARAAEDWERAYALFSATVAVMPTRSWARRRAEEARDHRLGYYEDQPWNTVFGPW